MAYCVMQSATRNSALDSALDRTKSQTTPAPANAEALVDVLPANWRWVTTEFGCFRVAEDGCLTDGWSISQ
jgi:hypothetical protein